MKQPKISEALEVMEIEWMPGNFIASLSPKQQRALYAGLIQGIDEMGCQFWACEGTDEPVTPMLTCNRCAFLIENRVKPKTKHVNPPNRSEVRATLQRAGLIK